MTDKIIIGILLPPCIPARMHTSDAAARDEVCYTQDGTISKER